MIRIALIEDDLPFANAIAKFFGLRGSTVACEAIYRSAEDALQHLPLAPPQVVLVDLNLPKLSGIDCIAKLKAKCPQLLCLVLTSYENRESIFDALKAGASGYLLKRTPPAEVAAAIEQVCQGGSPMSPQIARQVVSFFHRTPAASNHAGLTEREQQVIELLAQGAMYKEIADQLTITIETVRTYIKRIYDKLHAHSRTEAVRKYRGE